MTGVRPTCGKTASAVSALVSDQIAPQDLGELSPGETTAPAEITEVGFPDRAVSTSHVETPCAQCAVPGNCEPAYLSNNLCPSASAGADGASCLIGRAGASPLGSSEEGAGDSGPACHIGNAEHIENDEQSHEVLLESGEESVCEACGPFGLCLHNIMYHHQSCKHGCSAVSVGEPRLLAAQTRADTLEQEAEDLFGRGDSDDDIPQAQVGETSKRGG